MDVTVPTAELAETAGNAVRVLSGRVVDPVLSGLLISAESDGFVLAGTDRERSFHARCPGVTRRGGRVLVPGRPFAETLRALAEPEVRLAVEGARLAVRTAGGRFALPLLDIDFHPGVDEPPQVVGTVAGSVLAAAVPPVAAAASSDETVPAFTGIRVRSEGERLVLVATDRYRLAVCSLPWEPRRGGLDVLVPAAVLAETARQVRGTSRVSLHHTAGDAERVALTWLESTVTSGVLASPFPDEAKFFSAEAECSVTVRADVLAASVRRVAPYAGPYSSITLEVGDGEVWVRGSDPSTGEAEERVEVGICGERVSRAYRATYLAEALNAYGEATIRFGMRGIRQGSIITAVDARPGGIELRYLVMPLVPR
ncbi:DNA polymerase III subunit beta [Longimycelium tulufanense]|nr:DNA polymerase III subunit beta [Longimycelium tulufanense]